MGTRVSVPEGKVAGAWSYTSTLPYVFMARFLVKAKETLLLPLPQLVKKFPDFYGPRTLPVFTRLRHRWVQSTHSHLVSLRYILILTLPYLTSPYLTSPYLTTPNLTLPNVTLPHLTSPHLTTLNLTLPNVTLPHLTSPYLTTPNLTLSNVTLPHLICLDIVKVLSFWFSDQNFVYISRRHFQKLYQSEDSQFRSSWPQRVFVTVLG